MQILREFIQAKNCLRTYFGQLQNSFHIGEYERAIAALKNPDVGVYEALMMRNPQNCSRAFYTSTSVCEDVSINFSESYNNNINKAWEMPFDVRDHKEASHDSYGI